MHNASQVLYLLFRIFIIVLSTSQIEDHTCAGQSFCGGRVVTNPKNLGLIRNFKQNVVKLTKR